MVGNDSSLLTCYVSNYFTTQKTDENFSVIKSIYMVLPIEMIVYIIIPKKFGDSIVGMWDVDI